jgi:DNA polymerase
MNEAQQRAWQALQIGPAWRSRVLPGHDAADAPAPDAEVEWTILRQEVVACRACGLCETRQQTVFGAGDEQADWMVIGEAPGAEEDRIGEPFVGPAGKLLDSMLAAVGKSRQRGVYIANVLKCRPPGNRDPSPEEVERCASFLRRQIELVSPKLILVLGKVAAQSLLRTDASIASLRGRMHAWHDGARSIPLVVTYHPAYLLRTPVEKSKAWGDLLLALDATAGAAVSASVRR